MGWPVCAGAYPPPAAHRGAGAVRGCSCDRIGCPAPGAHPISAAWQVEATTDPVMAEAMWPPGRTRTSILATGRVFDVLDVPAPARARGPEPDGRGGHQARSRRAERGGPGSFLCADPRRPGGRAGVVVLPPGLRAGVGDRALRAFRTARAALALPGQLRGCPAVPAARRGRGAGGCASPAAIRCPTACGCSRCWPTPARGRGGDRRGRRSRVGRAVRPCARGDARRGELAGPGLRVGRRPPGVHGLGARCVPDRRGRPRVRGPGVLLGADDPGPRAPGGDRGGGAPRCPAVRRSGPSPRARSSWPRSSSAGPRWRRCGWSARAPRRRCRRCGWPAGTPGGAWW